MFKLTSYYIPFFLFITLLQYITTDNDDESLAIRLSLWFSYDSEQTSIHFSFPSQKDDEYCRLYIDLTSNISSIEEGISYDIESINPTQSQRKCFEEIDSVFHKDTIFPHERTDFQVPEFPFYLTKGDKLKQKHPEGRIALSRSSESALNQFYQKGKISNRIFALSEWEIFIGRTPKDMQNVNKAPLIDYYNQWATTLYSVVIGNIESLSKEETNHIDMTQFKHIDINLPLVLDSYNHKYIIFPYSYAKHFLDLLLFEKIEKGKCVQIDSNTEIRFECSPHVFIRDKVYFIMEGVIIELHEGHLNAFSSKAKIKESVFPIVFSKAVDDIRIGRKFAQKFHLVLDEDNKTMGFSMSIPSYVIDNVRSKAVIVNNEDMWNGFKYGYISVLVMLTFGIGLGIYIKRVIKVDK